MTDTTQDSGVRITRLELGPFGTNAYIVACHATGDSILVDAPAETGEILRRLQGTNPKYIVITHSHFDHIMVLSELVSHLKIPVAAHHLDAVNLPSPPEVELGDGDTMDVGQLKVRVLHTPGHTPGSICLLVGKHLISGDTLFPGGPGKTGTPADLKQIIDTLVTKIFVLPGDTEVYPGHGTPMVLAKEKEEFAVFYSRSHDQKLCGDVLWLSS